MSHSFCKFGSKVCLTFAIIFVLGAMNYISSDECGHSKHRNTLNAHAYIGIDDILRTSNTEEFIRNKPKVFEQTSKVRVLKLSVVNILIPLHSQSNLVNMLTILQIAGNEETL